MDGLTLTKMKNSIERRHPDVLLNPASQTAPGNATGRIIGRHMLERIQLKFATQFAVNSGKQVKVEVPRVAGCIIVGGPDNIGVLLEVKTHQESIARRHCTANQSQERNRLPAGIIPQVGAQEHKHPANAARLKLPQQVHVVSMDRLEIQPGAARDQPLLQKIKAVI